MPYDVVDFETEVLERSSVVPVVVDFWAEWCGPCRVLGPVLERLVDKHAGEWELKKLDTDAYPDVAVAYGIRGIPAVKMFVDGRVADEFVGALPEAAVEQWLRTALPDKHRDAIDTAEALLHSGGKKRARKALESIVAADGANERARSLLAAAIVYDDPDRAVALVEDIVVGAESERADAVRTFASLLQTIRGERILPDGPERDRYRTAIEELAAERFDPALEAFIDVVRADRMYDDDGARRACIAIFKYLGEDHEITQRHRREFDRALY